ncbi:MAG: DUF3822 family protein [Flavicella sp.]
MKETYLSIQISLDGFSFFIFDPDTAIYVAHHAYRLELENRTPEGLYERVEKIFKENSLLQESFKKVTVLHDNNLVTLVPAEYFSKDHLKEYLKNNIKLLEDDHIEYDSLEDKKTNVVYVPYVNINNLIFSSFGSFEFYHISTLFLDLKNRSERKSDMCYINCYTRSFDMLIYKNDQLVFFNRFEFSSATDFIYYILFALEQNDLDPNQLPIELTGEIQKESDEYKMAFNYIRNVSFYNKENSKLPEVYNDYAMHKNYIALHQYELETKE